MLHKLKAQSGGLTLLRVRHDAGNPAHLAAIFDASRTEPWVGIEFEAHPQHADKLRRIELLLMISPRIPGPAWPAETLERADRAAALQRRIQDAFDHDRFSGVVLVARGNDVLLHTAGGLANRERGIPNTLDTRFNTASVGKMLTGFASGNWSSRESWNSATSSPTCSPSIPTVQQLAGSRSITC